MVVDVSGSMVNTDFLWDGQAISRLDAVKKAIRLFVEGGTAPDGETLPGRPDDLVGLVVYATRPETACPLTLNHGVLLQILDQQMPRMLATEATTNTGDALAWALYSLQKAAAKRKVVVLLTDGEHNVPPPALDPLQAAHLAGNLGIPIYAIHAGSETDNDGTASEESMKTKRRLVRVAHISKGRYFRASDSDALLGIYEQIDRLERQEIQSFQYRRYAEGFAWFALASFVVWFAIQALETTIWRKVP
jgi:Ca-activated chloride channel family protein